MLSLGGGAPDAYSLQVLRDGGGGGGGSTPGWATVGRVASNNNEALCSLAARQVRSCLLVLSLSSTYLLTYSRLTPFSLVSLSHFSTPACCLAVNAAGSLLRRGARQRHGGDGRGVGLPAQRSHGDEGWRVPRGDRLDVPGGERGRRRRRRQQQRHPHGRARGARAAELRQPTGKHQQRGRRRRRRRRWHDGRVPLAAAAGGRRARAGACGRRAGRRVLCAHRGRRVRARVARPALRHALQGRVPASGRRVIGRA